MSTPSPGELVALQEELQRRITLGQPPAIAAELRRRFIVETLPLGAAAWSAFAFPIGLALVRQIPALPLLGVASEQIESLRDVVRRMQDLPVPVWAEPVDWTDLCERALERLEMTEIPIGGGEIGIPVVAGMVGNGAAHPIFANLAVGGILRLRVEVALAQRRGAGPNLFVEGDTAPETRASFERALRSLQALRVWGAPGPEQCVFRTTWNIPGARLVGCSGTFAFLLAAAVARARLSPSIRERSLAGELAATGDLDGTRVLPVDPEGLAAKVKACHHAGIRLLLVPESQVTAAKEEAARLAGAGQGHRVEVIGVDDVRRIWQRSRAVEQTTRGPLRFASGWLSWLTRSRARMALLLALLAAATAAAIVTTVRWEKDPVAAEWKDDRLLMRNRYGHTWLLAPVHPPGPDIFAQPDWGVPVAIVKPRGFSKAIAITILGAEPRGSDRLVAITPQGKILWEVRAQRIGERHRTPIDDVSWRAIYVPDPGPEGAADFYAVRRSIQSSFCLIDRIDPATGASSGCLRNEGHIEFSSRIDLTGDGIQEIVFMGTHNPDSCGIAVVIDPDRMRPISPADSLGSIPRIADPSSLRTGVAACWRFVNDRFSSQVRTTCAALYPDGDGVVKLCASGAIKEGSFLYRLRTTDPRRPIVLGVQMTDGYRAYQTEHTGKAATAEAIEAEQSRLAAGARMLTEEGWVPMPSEDAGISGTTDDDN